MAVQIERELLLLGLLRRSPMSAYDLDRAIRAHVPLYRPFKRGNVYHAVAALAQAGLLLQKAGAARRGPQQSKVLFRLSAAGERRFHVLLKSVLLDVQAADHVLEVAYVLLGQIPRSVARGLLCERAAAVSEQERRLARIVGDIENRGAAGSLAMTHNVSRLHGEERFLRDAIKLLENPKWNPEWVLDDGPIEDPRRRM